jgi:type VI secretion system protein VasI
VATGSWAVEIEQSALDDSRRVILSLESNEPIRARHGQAQPATLFVRCEENTTSLFIHFAGHFMSDNRGGGRIDYRIDDRSPARVDARESNNNMALGLWRGGSAIPFLRDLFGGQSLYVRATPFNESRVEATFAITGLEDAIRPLREACNW